MKYTKSESGYCFKEQAGKKKRISRAEYDKKTEAVKATPKKVKADLPKRGKQISKADCVMICRGEKNIGCMRRCLKY